MVQCWALSMVALTVRLSEQMAMMKVVLMVKVLGVASLAAKTAFWRVVLLGGEGVYA